MSARIKYADGPIGRVKTIDDFLPRPEEQAIRDEGVQVTIALSRRVVVFFKRETEKTRNAVSKRDPATP